ncbi:hypothetical protein UFOVP167_12 [uncultured Caudovirales phage]|uniref:Uncharacterized protein n=1 Tax=uncultured Caudovirales phage TaxID=2100421 RepID=A0A6J7WAT2_9CAUD|nr:hypothetical protein UFOVP167_12 [uncultured Caudovirales phage]
MSTLKVINSIHPSGSTNNLVFDNAGNTTAGGTLAMSSSFLRNRIINGNMRIDQRNNGTSGTSNSTYTVDRWYYYGSQANKVTWSQSAAVGPPVGFQKYFSFTSSSAYAVAASDEFDFYQSIEGFNVEDLAWGSANAKTVTLSFWVRSSLTGTFGGVLTNYNNSRSYPYSYVITSANTWEQKSITIPGDTSGYWLVGNGIGISVSFSLGAGSTVSGPAGSWSGSYYVGVTGATSVVATNGATFYITGVQLEVGSVATPFERRLYPQELALCQRYFNTVKAISGTSGNSSNTVYANVQYSEMRATPTYAVTGALNFTDPGTASYFQSSGNVATASGGNPNGAFLSFGNLSGMTANKVIMTNSSSTYLTLSAEL